MKNGVLAIIAIVALVWSFYLAITVDRTVVYDCRIAEISPDFPPEVREACRKRFMEQYNQERKIHHNI